MTDLRLASLGAGSHGRVVADIVECTDDWSVLDLFDSDNCNSPKRWFDVRPIHPSANASRHSRIGPSSVVMVAATVDIGTEVGAACIVNTGAVDDRICLIPSAVHGAAVVSDTTCDLTVVDTPAAALDRRVRPAIAITAT